MTKKAKAGALPAYKYKPDPVNLGDDVGFPLGNSGATLSKPDLAWDRTRRQIQ
jgi:hypothetical protein